MIEKIILKKSSVLDKMPAAEQLDYGEIALNFNTMNPFISFKDTADGIRQIRDYSNEIQIINGSLTDAKNEINYLRPLVTDNHTNLMFLRSDFEDFKTDNTNEINALRTDIDKNTQEITKYLKITDFNAFKADNTTAIATIIEQKADKTDIDTINAKVEQKVSKTDIVQNTGQSTTSVMSQKAVSDALSTKVDKSELDSYATKESTDTKVAKTDIVQSAGNATDKIMSQKASTDSFIANTPSGDPMHNLYVEVGAIYNDTGKDIERVDQWGDTIIHKDGCWYLNGLGDLTNYDLLKCWIWGNCIITNYNFTYSSRRNFMDTKTNIHQNIKDIYTYKLSDTYKSLQIVNKSFKTFVFNEHDANTANNDVKNLYSYTMYSTDIIKYYGWIVVGSIDKYTFSTQDKTEAIGLVLTKNSYINLPKLRADCIRQIIEAVRVTDNITITIHPEAYDRAIADAGVQTALTNKTNVSLARGE